MTSSLLQNLCSKLLLANFAYEKWQSCSLFWETCAWFIWLIGQDRTNCQGWVGESTESLEPSCQHVLHPASVLGLRFSQSQGQHDSLNREACPNHPLTSSGESIQVFLLSSCLPTEIPF